MHIKQLRQQIKLKRQSLSLTVQQKAAQKIAATISKLPSFKNSSHIAAYIASQGEIDPRPLLEIAWQNNKTCYLPIVNPNYTLTFIKYQPGDKLIKNKYGILEPILYQTKVIEPQNLDLVITPLVLFDANNNRVGTGAGFYDRTFAFKKQLPKNSKPFLLGIAYEFQRVEQLIPNPWDVSLDMVITSASASSFRKMQ